jgi:hypothetical protein
MSIKKPYTTPQNGPSTTYEIKLHENINKARFILENSLSHYELVKVMILKTAKETLDTLEEIYEGDGNFKQAKLQNLETQFETLRMTKDENIKSYVYRVDEVVGGLRGLCTQIEESMILKKILKNLPDA